MLLRVYVSVTDTYTITVACAQAYAWRLCIYDRRGLVGFSYARYFPAANSVARNAVCGVIYVLRVIINCHEYTWRYEGLWG